LIGLLGFATVLVLAGATAIEAGDEVLVRPRYVVGQSLHYRWHLESESRWQPPVAGAEWGTMRTDFQFTLAADRMQPDGGCLFGLHGNYLESVAEGPKGAIGIRATPEKGQLLLGRKWLRPGSKTPLMGPMSITFGPRFQVTASKGVEPLALYFLPGGDPRIWLALMAAPQDPVRPGQRWNQSFTLPVKELGDRPLQVDVVFRVDEISYGNVGKVVLIRVAAQLALDDFELQLKGAGPIHVTAGRLSIDGSARWLVDRGVLQQVVAEQRLTARSDRPQTTFTLRALSRLELADDLPPPPVLR
jgi:hypothetical protein